MNPLDYRFPNLELTEIKNNILLKRRASTCVHSFIASCVGISEITQSATYTGSVSAGHTRKDSWKSPFKHKTSSFILGKISQIDPSIKIINPWDVSLMWSRVFSINAI